MHVLMVSDVYFPRVNGVSTSIQTFRKELLTLGVESTLIAPAYDGHNKLIYDIENDIIRVPSGRIMFDPEDRILKKKYLADISTILETILASRRYDLIHIQTPFIAHSMGMALAKKMSVPVIETYHTFFEEYFYHYIPFLPKAWLRFAARWFSRTQCNRLDALVVPSTAMQDKLQEYGISTRMSIIPTGITMPDVPKKNRELFLQKQKIPVDRPVLLHIGRVAFEKNIGFLIDVLSEVKNILPEVILLIAGEGPAKTSLQKKVQQSELQDSVYFIGYLSRESELLECYQAGDIFVFSSKTEMQGLVLLEAMAMGLPVVSTAEMGTKDILFPQKGAIIANEDTKDFSDKVVTVLQDKARQKLMTAEAIDYVKQWSSPIMAEKMRDFYQHIYSSVVKTDVSVMQCTSRLAVERA